MTRNDEVRRVVKICENCGEPKYSAKGMGCTCYKENKSEKRPPVPFNPQMAGKVTIKDESTLLNTDISDFTVSNSNVLVEYWEAKAEAEKCYKEGWMDAFKNSLHMYDKFLAEEKEEHGIKPKTYEHASDRLLTYLEDEVRGKGELESRNKADEQLLKRLDHWQSKAEEQRERIGGVRERVRAKISELKKLLDELGVDYEEKGAGE